MKQRIVYVLTIAMLLCGKAKAQKVILPFGQFTQQPWTASYFHALIGGETPPDNWFEKDFDDTEWGILEGPISTSSGIYRASSWERNSSTIYWLRRHFIISDINTLNEYPFVSMYLLHDDGCEIYLNNALIYSNDTWLTTVATVNMTEEMRSHFVEGDNVIAVKVSDVYGEGFMDFGIEADNVPPLTNLNFDNGFNGWSYKGGGFESGGQSYNRVARCLSNNPFDVHQTVKAGKTGLYRLRAQAFEGFEDSGFDWGWEQYKNGKPTIPYLYINNQKHIIKSIFEDAVKSNDYYSNNRYYKTSDNTYVPTYMTSASIAFQNGLYDNEFYAYVDTTVFDIGIAMSEQVDMARWTVFDNFRLEYISEKDLGNIISEIESLPAPSSGKDPNVLALTNKLKTAKDYESKCHIIAESSEVFSNARRYSEQIALVRETVDALQHGLDTRKNTNVVVVEEAKTIIASTNSRLSEGTLSEQDTQDVLVQLNDLIKRLSYVHIDLTISVPGSFGDSVLNKVEDFVDVQSLTISGTLNDADYATIQSRLTQLREIDMTNVKMTELPNNLFYEHSLLEKVKFPTALTKIGEYAFYKCSALMHIDFPETITEICRSAFERCTNLQEVILPEGLTTLGIYVFQYCENCKYAKLPSSLKILNYNMFCDNYKLATVDFAEGLTHIYNGAFGRCYLLNNVKLPSTLYYIGQDAFWEDVTLSNIELNEGLFQIGSHAFGNCQALSEITLPSSLVRADGAPFYGCNNLTKVTCLSVEPPYMTSQIPTGHDLYVPALSINAYKQTTEWDKFQNIKPIDCLPKNISVLGDLKLTLPEDIPFGYKPNVSIIHDLKGTNDYYYGSLTVNGYGTLSMGKFDMVWDPNIQFAYKNRSQTYCSLLNNSHLRADSVSITVYSRNDRWTFLSLPFDVKISDIETISDGTTNWVVRKYDGQKRASGESADTWVKMTGDDIMKAGEGYIIQGSRYIDNQWQDYSGFRMKAVNNGNKNNIFRADDITVTLNEYQSEFAHNRSWNLIGNPYPCYYDTRYMDYDTPFIVWNMNNSTYTAYSPIDDSYVLCPSEAFFVQRPVDKGTIVFNKDGRQTNRDVRTIESSARRATAMSTRTIVNLVLSDGNNYDRTRIVLNDKASLQYELGTDASKFMSTDVTVPQIYTSADGVDYAINERPYANGTVDLSTYFGTEGIYTITLANNVKGYKIVLEDKEENKRIVLTEGDGYVFSAKAQSNANRFVVHFTSETTGIEDIRSNEGDNPSIYSIEGIKIDTPTKKGLYIQNGKKLMLNK